jgi:Transposase DDE domain
MKTTKICTDLAINLLNELKVEEKAHSIGFIKNSMQSKVTGSSFVIGFWLMMAEGKNTLSAWVEKIGQLSKYQITPQGLEYKFWSKGSEFCKSLFEESMTKRIASTIESTGTLFSSFRKVYIEDSTHISINQQLKDAYKGSFSKKNGHGAIVKFQVTIELLQSQITKIGIGDFRKNDQSYAADLIERVEKGSLVLRDLGYFVLDVFKQMNDKGVYFVSRAKPNVHVFDPRTQDLIKLSVFLKESSQVGEIVDIEVQLGVEDRLPVRLVAQKLPQEVASRRRQAAKEDRNKKANHSAEYLLLLGWAIVITNVEKEMLSAQDLFKVYRCRWRIEILFKAWKSAALNLNQILSQKMSLIRFEITVYLSLMFIVLFCQAGCAMIEVVHRNCKNEKSNLSILKVFAWIVNNFKRICALESINMAVEVFMDEIMHSCRYQNRSDRLNFADLFT